MAIDGAPCAANAEGSVMDFYAVLAQVSELLQREGRVSYRALKVQFSLDDDQLEALKDERIEAKRLAVDERGRVLVWVGEASPAVPPTMRSSPAAPLSDVQLDHPVQSASLATIPPSPDAERRQLTVMFCDLVDSTILARAAGSGRLPGCGARLPGGLRAAAIQPFDGYVAQYLGDGLLVYFGYPQAHEDAAQRAVRAGLAIPDRQQAAAGPGSARPTRKRSSTSPRLWHCWRHSPRPRARAAGRGVDLQVASGAGIDGHQGLGSSGGGTDLRPRTGVVSADWGDTPALPDFRVNTPPPGHTWSRASPSPTRRRSGPWCSAMAMAPGVRCLAVAACDAVVPGLSGAGRAAESGGAGPGPGAGPSLESGDGPALCGLPASPPP